MRPRCHSPTPHPRTWSSPRTVASLAALVLLGACTGDPPAEAADAVQIATYAPAAGEPTLDEIRELTERFRDVNVALAEGYIRDPSDHCVTAEMEGRPAEDGAMGIHYFRPDLLGITGPPNPKVDGVGTYTDFRMPSVLIYEPQADGSLELVAVENLVFLRAWEAAGHRDAPTLHGRAWDRMVDDPATEVDEAHGFEAHYDQHLWIFRENPEGVYAPFNPNVTCRHHVGGHAAH
jgi:hypothetical protein